MSDVASPPAPPALPGGPHCPNCGAPAPERFCGACGQEQAKSLRVPIHRLAGEAIAETFTLDSKLGQTLRPLLLRPGAVTRAFLDGKRARFTSPVKLYLLVSFVFFLVSALRPELQPHLVTAETGDEAIQISDEDLAGIRAQGELGRRVADRVEALTHEPPAQLRSRISAGFAERIPQAMFVLVPVLALLLRGFYARTRVYVAEHLVFALHAHAVAFLLLLPAAATGSGAVTAAGLAATSAHAVVAMRRVYGLSWRGTIARAAGSGFLYLVALGLALAAAGVWALWSA